MDTAKDTFCSVSNRILNFPHEIVERSDKAMAWCFGQVDLYTTDLQNIHRPTTITPHYLKHDTQRVERMLENFERGREFTMLPEEERWKREKEFMDVTPERLDRLRKNVGIVPDENGCYGPHKKKLGMHYAQNHRLKDV